MSTKILQSEKLKELQPASALWRMYRPQTAAYRFTANSVRQAKAWQAKTSRALARTVNLNWLPSTQVTSQRIERVDKKDYVREKILLRTSRDTKMPVYLLKPKGFGERLPVVLALHGHGYGVKDIVGLWEDGQERDVPDGYHKDFAVALCRHGFLVAAPEISCFGERQTDFSYLSMIGQPTPTTCAHSAFLAFHLGGSLVGLRVHDAMRLVDYLSTRNDVDTHRLGAMGISGGGMHTLFSTALDTRIKACVISGYYSTFRDSILAMNHCPCNYVPGLHEFGEMYDLVGLIAPRPLLIEAGTYDPIFPIAAVKRSVTKARAVYRIFGTAAVDTDYFQGRHQISGRKAYRFLQEHL